MTTSQNTVRDIDARGLLCPLPVLRARKALLQLAPGDVLRILADDPMARIDMPHFCMQSGHSLIDVTEAGDHQIYRIACGTSTTSD